MKVQVARIRAKTETSRQGEFISLVLRAFTRRLGLNTADVIRS